MWLIQILVYHSLIIKIGSWSLDRELETGELMCKSRDLNIVVEECVE